MPSLKTKSKKKTGFQSVWGGPHEEGITQSLLSRFLVCRERFRLLVIGGLKPDEGFSSRLHYGQMWHVCEEEIAANRTWEDALRRYAQDLCRQNPLQQEQVQHWYNVCKVQFPIYFDFWSKRREAGKRTPLVQEQVFCEPYVLPSGRIVKLKGKYDSIDFWDYGGKNNGVYLMENKTKGDIDEQQMQRQLTFDLQTMMYLIAMRNGNWTAPVRGVRYNVVRRPLSGGKGTIRRHQPTKSNPQGESAEEFYERVAEYIRNEPEHYFMRWTVDVLPGDYEKFEKQFFQPCLEQLCDWWEFVSGGMEGNNKLHYRLPYGIHLGLFDGGESELDEYMRSGSTLGLRKVSNLFPELK